MVAVLKKIALIVSLVTPTCFSDSSLYREAHRKLDSKGGPEFTYRRRDDGVEPLGPSEWYLGDGYGECNGTSQSPINLSAAYEEERQIDLKFYPASCPSSELAFSVSNHFFLVNFENCKDSPHVKFHGETFNVLQMHFHSASEHTIGSTHHDAEVHLVHLKEGTNDELLVVGVLIDASSHGDNEQVADLWDVLLMRVETAAEARRNFTTDIYDLLPATPTFVHYTGSLTTPPCTEGVRWIVMTEPILISELQLDEYRHSVALLDNSMVDELGNTNRPTQPLNGRPVYYCS